MENKTTELYIKIKVKENTYTLNYPFRFSLEEAREVTEELLEELLERSKTLSDHVKNERYIKISKKEHHYKLTIPKDISYKIAYKDLNNLLDGLLEDICRKLGFPENPCTVLTSPVENRFFKLIFPNKLFSVKEGKEVANDIVEELSKKSKETTNTEETEENERYIRISKGDRCFFLIIPAGVSYKVSLEGLQEIIHIPIDSAARIFNERLK